ncbi:MAG TPA: 2'-5' RNA ligase family protein [Gaiellaceae bacterium]
MWYSGGTKRASRLNHELRKMLAAFQPFEFVLGRFATFPAPPGGPPVLYLEPDPPERFQEMTDALVRAFPDYPPFGGQFTTLVPHLTVAEDDAAPLTKIRDDIAPVLPIAARAERALVMRHGADGWRIKSRIGLGRRDGA